MGHTLISASLMPIAGTGGGPSVVLRLTRLDPDPSDGPNDPRIGQINLLRKTAIDVQLGEREFKSIPESSSSIPTEFCPTNKINEDLLMLIALVSDLSHAALPGTEKEAKDRLKVPSHGPSWKLEKFHKHQQSLLIKPLWNFGRQRKLGNVAYGSSNTGGVGEKQRTRALFKCYPEEDVTGRREEFWKSSRHLLSYLSTLIPIKIFSPDRGQHPTSVPSIFWGHLIRTCRHILEYNSTTHPSCLFHKYDEVERAKVSTVNTKLTMHTAMESMLVGACEGMTE
ncbi:hypothetical protein M422DRAFT_248371 [Sphaerobolus stellatus SS14]|uniref:Uncharacterized protein n=1 Tax=Sphaerobolus stellatus (strain SS14) TaxID=990650 RepID=A0A0C9W4K6_SPHS4|nr:hypothetical protein M422DRAFT_248371 [Sphaerobolus stellatus SS14]